MKDYEVTKIWAKEVAQTCSLIDSIINDKKDRINHLEEFEEKDKWTNEEIQELQESIKCLEWQIKQLTCPFKIKQ